jgi:hypothetical protein
LNDGERLGHDGQTGDPCELARLAASAGRLDEAVSVLRRVHDAVAGLPAARDLAILQRDRLGDADTAR